MKIHFGHRVGSTTPSTELPGDFFAGIGPLQLGVVLVLISGQIKGSKIIAMNVRFGFYCKTPIYHPYKLLQNQTNRFVHFSELGHFRSRVCNIETRHRTLKTHHVTKSGNVRDNSWKFEEYIIKNMVMSRFQHRDLFLVRPVNGVYKDGIHTQFHFSLRIRRTSVRRSLALVITK